MHKFIVNDITELKNHIIKYIISTNYEIILKLNDTNIHLTSEEHFSWFDIESDIELPIGATLISIEYLEELPFYRTSWCLDHTAGFQTDIYHRFIIRTSDSSATFVLSCRCECEGNFNDPSLTITWDKFPSGSKSVQLILPHN